jgi:hypothetical protein
MGQPEIYTLRLGVETDGRISDAAEVNFGIREVTFECHRLQLVHDLRARLHHPVTMPQ